MTPTQPSQAAPKLPSHPEPHSMTWSRLELETISDYGVRCFEAGRAELARPQSVAAVGDWLWSQLMDYCKKRGAHPGENNDLFAIVSRAREQFASQRVPVALPAPSIQELAAGAFYPQVTGFTTPASHTRPDSFHSGSGECDRVQRPWPTNAELALRRLLCLTFSRGLAYTDDGEMSDSQRHPSIDFLRDSPADIEAKIMQRNADTLTAPVQTVLCEHSGCGSNTQIDSLTVRLNPGDKVVLLKGRMTQGFDRADAAILASKPTAGEVKS